MPGRIFTHEERQAAQHHRRAARQRMADEASATVEKLLAEADGMPAWALAHAEKARTGKFMSLVVLKCGDCSGWQKAEIAGCTVTSCPLYPLRPYRE